MANAFSWISSTTGGYWSDPDNWLDVTTGVTPAGPPSAGDTVTLGGGTGFVFQILGGPGQAGELTMVGNTAIEGAITAATAFFGTIASLEPSPSYTNAQAIDIEPASVVTVTDGAAIFNPFEIDGSGANLNVTGGLFNGLSGYGIGQQIVVVNFGSLLADTATLYGGSLYIDPTAVTEVGSAGGAAAGVLTIDNAATLTTEASATINANVTDNGVILVADTTAFDDAISGTGTLDLEASTTGFTASAATSVTGLASIVVGAVNTLDIAGTAGSVGLIDVGSGASLSAGALSDDGPITDDGFLTVATDVTGSSTIAVGTGASLSIGGTLSGLSVISMGLNSVFDLSGQDTNVPIALGTGNNVLINLSEGSNIDGAVTGFDSSDLIASLQTLTETYITSSAVWSSGTLSLLSGATTVVSSLALAGNYTGQQFLTNAVGIAYGSTDIVLPSGFITTGIGSGAQRITGSASKQFTLLTGGGNAGVLTETGNIALEGTYTATSLLLDTSDANTIDALDLQAHTALTVSGDASVQSNLELDGPGSTMSIGGSLTVGGASSYFGEVLVINAAHLQAQSLTLLGETSALGSINSNPDMAILGDASVELGSIGGVAADTLQIDQGHTLTGAVEDGTIKVDFVVDNGVITQVASAQGLSQLTLAGDVSGTGTIDAVGDLYINGSLTGIAVATTAQNATFSVGGDLSAVGSVTIATGATFKVGGSFADAIAIEVGASGTFNVEGDTTGITSLLLDNAASSDLTGVLSDVGPITLDDNASLSLDNGGTGSGFISTGTNTTFSNGGTLSGWSGISLGASSTLTDTGEIDAPITLHGSDEISLYAKATIVQPITGFNDTDIFVSNSSGFYLGGIPITGALWQQGVGNSGTLTLSDDGVTLFTFTLNGNYTAQTFITSAVGMVGDIADGTSNVTLALATQNGLNGATLTGSTGLGYTLLTGSGTQASLTTTDNVAVAGSFTLGTLTAGFGDLNTTNALLIEAGASIKAATVAIDAKIEVDGPGATLDVSGTLTMNADHPVDLLMALDDAHVQVGSLTTDNPNNDALDTSILAVDKTASIEVGTAGDATLGAVTVDAGATFDSTTGTNVDSALVINGTFVSGDAQLDGGATVYDGNITGTGTLLINYGGYFSTPAYSIIGLSNITLTAATLHVGDNLTNIGTITAADGTGITVDGAMTGGGNITIGGTVTTDKGAALTVDGNASGIGTLTLGDNSTATIYGVTSGFTSIVDGPRALLNFEDAETGSPITMQAGSGIQFGPLSPVSGVISGFNHSNVLEFRQGAADIIITAAVWTAGSGGLGTLTLSDDGVDVTSLTLAGNYTGQQFLTNYAGNGGMTDITVASLPCFAAGTTLKTARGDIAVEDLRAGDHVSLAHGGIAPVIWIGHRHIDCARHPRPAEVWPVRIRAGAFSADAPVRDLWLSPDHAVYFQGVLVPIKQLINGTTIVQVPRDRVTYYHVELPTHDVLLAEGLPAESYLDTGNRSTFANSGAPWQLYPNLSEADAQARREAHSCAELVCDPQRVEALWRQLASRAAALGMPVAPVETTDEPMLRIVAGDRIISPVHHQAGRYQFVVPPVRGFVRLVSRSASPSLTRPWTDDRRQLGVMVKRISVRSGADHFDLAMDDPRLANGWWAPERDGTAIWRWTNGDALLPIEQGPALIDVVVGETLPYSLAQSRPEADRFAA